ncbi:type II toxin-antitoxin system Phd/YefM family antitoxin [Collinsella sp. An2]|uniref:type II toxin-antitoxin system Phd/YefM family antitoxin n=1 Tax=Collinsella sp. An2 TaxID=1965585 RepID=UPI000B398AE4|nr:type II toxin-antitoxin system Phd/YefM family antitoxin [Collinsella sp. An2]OUP07827.1 prevent-host-death protein [Collinsella sp. An2]
MQSIRPVSDLRNKFAEVSRDVHESGQPVFLAKNGVGDMVVMSMEAFESLEFDSRVYTKLQEAEREAEVTGTRYSSDEVLASIRSVIAAAAEQDRAVDHV